MTMASSLKEHGGPLLLGALVVGGIVAGSLLGDPERVLTAGQQLTADPWRLAALVVLMAVLFTFALPGSLVVWLIAPFVSPWIAVPLLVTGSTLGALGGYWLAGRLGADRGPLKRHPWLVEALRRHGDFLHLMAMRTFPGFPHSVINYAAGMLRLSRVAFVLATILGLSVKWGVYASVLYGAAEAIERGDALDLRTLVPLAVLAVLLLAGGWLRQRVRRSVEGPAER
ncbi:MULTISPECIES: VTT domain-containing protein [unclassified Thioalkalivibrio]|uniref:TVP38/TMEM64 family protein n=1 Tax=unclassified Thioalkalivibrio TaxID=2621013 RepID=UPI00035F0EC0